MNAILKAWFIGRLAREKVLLVAFVLLGALIWLSSALERFGETRTAARTVKSELDTQSLWLENRLVIEEAAAAAVRNLEASRTLNDTFLVAEVQAMAGRSGLQVVVEPPRTQRSPQFAVHTVLVRSQRASMPNLLRFYQELSARAPYVGLEQVSLRIDRASPGAVSADFQVTSVELVRR